MSEKSLIREFAGPRLVGIGLSIAVGVSFYLSFYTFTFIVWAPRLKHVFLLSLFLLTIYSVLFIL